jgi:glutamate formiminotransferase
LPGVRALGVKMDDELSQVSMNLIDPETTGIDRAYSEVAEAARGLGAEVVATEIVGLVPERFLPDPHAQAARLLMAPGRSLEATL